LLLCCLDLLPVVRSFPTRRSSDLFLLVLAGLVGLAVVGRHRMVWLLRPLLRRFGVQVADELGSADDQLGEVPPVVAEAMRPRQYRARHRRQPRWRSMRWRGRTEAGRCIDCAASARVIVVPVEKEPVTQILPVTDASSDATVWLSTAGTTAVLPRVDQR